MLSNDPGVRLGEDTEALHQLRVATRRSRALLRAGRGLVARGWAEPLRAELEWLGGLLGPVRDLDVLLEHLDSEAATLEARRRPCVQTAAFAARRGAATATATRCSKRCAASATSGSSTRCRRRRAPAGESATAAAPRSPGSAFARSAESGEGACRARPTDDELHAVRIEAKRARYAAELAAPDLGKTGRQVRRSGEGRPGRDRRAPGRRRRRGQPARARPARRRQDRRLLRAGSSSGSGGGSGRPARALPGAWKRLEKAGRRAFS